MMNILDIVQNQWQKRVFNKNKTVPFLSFCALFWYKTYFIYNVVQQNLFKSNIKIILFSKSWQQYSAYTTFSKKLLINNLCTVKPLSTIWNWFFLVKVPYAPAKGITDLRDFESFKYPWICIKYKKTFDTLKLFFVITLKIFLIMHTLSKFVQISMNIFVRNYTLNFL